MATPVLLTDDNETKAKKIAAAAGITPTAQVNVSPDTAAPLPAVPNPADTQAPVAPAPNAGLTPAASPVATPELPPVVLNDASIPAPLTPAPSLKGLGPATPATPPNQAIIQDAGTGQVLAAGSGPATGGFGMSEPLRLAEVARQDAASKEFQRGMDRTRMIDANDAVTRARIKMDGAQTPLELQQAQAGLTAAQAQLATTAGYDQHINTNETTMQGHVVTAKEKADALKATAQINADARRDAATTTADAQKFTAEQNRIAREGLTSKEDLQQKRDISTRLREGQRAHQAAVKSGDTNQIAAAVDYLDQLNQDAKTYGVATIPLPPRPKTTEEVAQATEEVTPAATAAARAKQGKVAKFFGLDPSKTAIEAEVKRLLPAAKGLEGIPQPATVASAAKPAAPAATTAQKTVVARAVKDGVTYLKYSDGSVETVK